MFSPLWLAPNTTAAPGVDLRGLDEGGPDVLVRDRCFGNLGVAVWHAQSGNIRNAREDGTRIPQTPQSTEIS